MIPEEQSLHRVVFAGFLLVPKERGIDIQKALHEFHKRFYSAHLMTLAVQAPLPLEELERLVLATFSGVPNNGLPAPLRVPPPTSTSATSARAPAGGGAEEMVVDKEHEDVDEVAAHMRAWRDPFASALAGSAFARRRYEVRGVKDVDRLCLTWSLPSFLARYREKPLNVLSYLIGHEGPGSIIHSLRRR